MDQYPPPGSNISITTDAADPTIMIPSVDSPYRYFVGLLGLIWLGMWFFAFRNVSSKVMAGSANGFLIFWLSGWTLGGIYAALTLYKLLRPLVPESLELKRNGVTYDSGIAPPPFNWDSYYGALFSSKAHARNLKDSWKYTFSKRVRVDFDQLQLESLRLRETESGNRLTIDVGATRLDIASAASEVEREWLALFLAHRYSLDSVLGDAIAGAAV
jgi:hypothetical protein